MRQPGMQAIVFRVPTSHKMNHLVHFTVVCEQTQTLQYKPQDPHRAEPAVH